MVLSIFRNSSFICLLLLSSAALQAMSTSKKRKRKRDTFKTVLKNRTAGYVSMCLKELDTDLGSVKKSGLIKRGDAFSYTLDYAKKYILTLMCNGCEMYYKLTYRYSKSRHLFIILFSPLTEEGSEDYSLDTIRGIICDNTVSLRVNEEWFH